MSLADQIIETGPVPSGETFTVHCTPSEINGLRDELIAARRGGRVSPEDMLRFRFPMLRLDDAGTYLACDRDGCYWEYEIQSDETLAELVQRAEEHTEVCR